MQANVPNVIDVGDPTASRTEVTNSRLQPATSSDHVDEESQLVRRGGPQVTDNFVSFEAECPKCKYFGKTEVGVYHSDAAFVVCCIMFLLCLWPCCFLPFCLGGERYKFLRDCEHRCV